MNATWFGFFLHFSFLKKDPEASVRSQNLKDIFGSFVMHFKRRRLLIACEASLSRSSDLQLAIYNLHERDLKKTVVQL